MKIALTGGSGGIGRAITEAAVAEGHTIVSIDRVDPSEEQASSDKVSFVKADMDEYDALVEAFRGCDAMIHMAAIPAPNPKFTDHELHNNNVVGSYNAMRAAIEVGIRRICQASSVNAIGHSFSREPRYDYFPIDEEHPNYSEEPYSLSKWICERQADAFCRRYEDLTIASMRFHWAVPSRETAGERFNVQLEHPGRHLWAYTLFGAAASACLLSLTAGFKGHEAFYIVGPDTTTDEPSLDLAKKYFPGVPIRGYMTGNNSFFNSQKAMRMLGWSHPRCS